jgi:hypothetical protein
MPDQVAQELARLPRLGVADLRRRYAELFGDIPRTGNKAWLVKRLAWRLQALAEGDLCERARRRAMELAQDADLRLPATSSAPPGSRVPSESATGCTSRILEATRWSSSIGSTACACRRSIAPARTAP